MPRSRSYRFTRPVQWIFIILGFGLIFIFLMATPQADALNFDHLDLTEFEEAGVESLHPPVNPLNYAQYQAYREDLEDSLHFGSKSTTAKD